MMANRTLLSTLLLLAGFVYPAKAEDWPQYMGINRDGKSLEQNIIRSWGEGSVPDILWKIDLENGYGGAAVRDGIVYITDRTVDKDNSKNLDCLRALDLVTGTTIWTTNYAAPGKESSPSTQGARSTPAVSNTHIFTYGPMGHLTCFDRSKGKIIWQKNLKHTFALSKIKYGICQSPLLYKDMVLISVNSQLTTVVAYNQKSGKLVWKTKKVGSGQVNYVSPIVADVAGSDHVVVIVKQDTGRGKNPKQIEGQTVGINPVDGSLLWSYAGWQTPNPIPHPVDMGNGRLLLTSPTGAGCSMIKVTKENNSFTVKEIFKSQQACSNMHQPLFIDGYLYMNANDRKIKEGMICMDTQGVVQWSTKREPNFGCGNMIYADGVIFNYDSKTGEIMIIKPDPKKYIELDCAKILNKRHFWAPMALSRGKLLVRDAKQLICINVQKK